MSIKNKEENKKKTAIEHPLFGYFVFTCFLLMEGVGLIVQYGMGIPPCSNCVITRAFICLIGLAGILITIGNKTNKTIFYHLGYLSCLTGTLGANYFNYDNFLIESGEKIATCSLESPFIEQLPLDSWFPSLFEPNAMCGTAVEVFGNITLTEITMTGLLATTLTSTAMYINYIIKNKN